MTERGSVTFWVLGLAMAVATVGVLSVDLWSLIGDRRTVAATVDAAALAAATAIDESEWRASGRLRLDREVAEDRARALVGADPRDVITVDFGLDGVSVRVSVVRTVRTALLGLAGVRDITVGAAAEATARRRD